MKRAGPKSALRALTRCGLAAAALLTAATLAPATFAGSGDARIRLTAYAPDTVYALRGYVGYQIDLQFESGESFVGLGAGDLESLTFAAQDNHLFLKPRAARVETNLTVLTTRRTYQFDYSVSAQPPDLQLGDVVYTLRFTYPPAVAAAAATALERQLGSASGARAHNLDYGYCGSLPLKPVAAWDDGVQTHLRFGARQELPAIFARNEDGSESLVNFNIEADEVIVHRVGRELLVRRGRLAGRILNLSFAGGGERLESGTVAPQVRRLLKEEHP
jgi:type IV secretion system protein VirB9